MASAAAVACPAAPFALLETFALAFFDAALALLFLAAFLGAFFEAALAFGVFFPGLAFFDAPLPLLQRSTPSRASARGS